MPRMTLKILGRDYLFNVFVVVCVFLLVAAVLFNSRAQRLHTADTTLTAERLAATAALEIAFDSISGRRGENPEDAACAERMLGLRSRCEAALKKV